MFLLKNIVKPHQCCIIPTFCSLPWHQQTHVLERRSSAGAYAVVAVRVKPLSIAVAVAARCLGVSVSRLTPLWPSRSLVAMGKGWGAGRIWCGDAGTGCRDLFTLLWYCGGDATVASSKQSCCASKSLWGHKRFSIYFLKMFFNVKKNEKERNCKKLYTMYNVIYKKLQIK